MVYYTKQFRSYLCLTRLRTRHFSGFFFYFDCGQKWDKVLFYPLKTTAPKCTKVDTIIANIMVYQAKQFRSDSCLTRAGMRHLTNEIYRKISIFSKAIPQTVDPNNAENDTRFRGVPKIFYFFFLLGLTVEQGFMSPFQNH
jgi:hypothetical protein